MKRGGPKPSLLCSFFYIKPWLSIYKTFNYEDWVLDSGAYSAHNSGVTIDIEEYIECCKELMATDPTLSEIYALDVIGDHRASLKNTERMWKAGVPAIPTYHPGEPIESLHHIAKCYPKIAIGGLAKKSAKYRMQFTAKCFKEVWPKKIHGFALATEGLVMGFPFHSVDSTSWEIKPCGFGFWRAFGRMSVRGSSQNLRAEVDWYLRLQERARSRWRKEMQMLETLPGGK